MENAEIMNVNLINSNSDENFSNIKKENCNKDLEIKLGKSDDNNSSLTHHDILTLHKKRKENYTDEEFLFTDMKPYIKLENNISFDHDPNLNIKKDNTITIDFDTKVAILEPKSNFISSKINFSKQVQEENVTPIKTIKSDTNDQPNQLKRSSSLLYKKESTNKETENVHISNSKEIKKKFGDNTEASGKLNSSLPSKMNKMLNKKNQTESHISIKRTQGNKNFDNHKFQNKYSVAAKESINKKNEAIPQQSSLQKKMSNEINLTPSNKKNEVNTHKICFKNNETTYEKLDKTMTVKRLQSSRVSSINNTKNNISLTKGKKNNQPKLCFTYSNEYNLQCKNKNIKIDSSVLRVIKDCYVPLKKYTVQEILMLNFPKNSFVVNEAKNLNSVFPRRSKNFKSNNTHTLDSDSNFELDDSEVNEDYILKNEIKNKTFKSKNSSSKFNSKKKLIKEINCVVKNNIDSSDIISFSNKPKKNKMKFDERLVPPNKKRKMNIEDNEDITKKNKVLSAKSKSSKTIVNNTNKTRCKRIKTLSTKEMTLNTNISKNKNMQENLKKANIPTLELNQDNTVIFEVIDENSKPSSLNHFLEQSTYVVEKNGPNNINETRNYQEKLIKRYKVKDKNTVKLSSIIKEKMAECDIVLPKQENSEIEVINDFIIKENVPLSHLTIPQKRGKGNHMAKHIKPSKDWKYTKYDYSEISEYIKEIPFFTVTQMDSKFENDQIGFSQLSSQKDEKYLIYSCIRCSFFSCTKLKFLKQHINLVHKDLKRFQCTICNYQTNAKTQLFSHINTNHIKIKSFKCEKCPYEATDKKSLYRHELCVHTNIKMFKCEYCNFSANQKCNLVLHVQAKHHNIKPYKCSMCDYCSGQKKKTEKHFAAVHLKIKEYKCHLCTFEVTDQRYLTSHLVKKHNVGEKLECKFCNFITGSELTLSKHKKSRRHLVKSGQIENIPSKGIVDEYILINELEC